MRIDLNTSLKNNIHENSLTKTMTKNQYKIYPRSKVEKLVTDFIEKHKIYAQYGKDTEGLFNVQFLVEEKEDE